MSTLIPLCEGSKIVVWRVYPGSTKRVKVGTYANMHEAARAMARG